MSEIHHVAIRANSVTMSTIVRFLIQSRRPLAARIVYKSAQVASVPGRELVSYLPESTLTAILHHAPRDTKGKPWLEEILRVLSRAQIEAKLDPVRNTRSFRLSAYR
jgi:hypothetical protein